MNFPGTINDGILSLDNAAELHTYLKTFPTGKRVEVSVAKLKNKRSIDQNAYYWSGVIGTIAKETGQDPQSVHETCKSMFRSRSVLFRGKWLRMVDSSKDADTIEFTEYIERIRAYFGEEFHITIPDPQALTDTN
jgi:hypothetical protein